MTKIIASIVLAASVFAGVNAANATPKVGDAAKFFAELARNGN